MDFRIIVLSFSLWLSPAYSLTLEQLEQLNTSVFQYPSKALNNIHDIEQQLHAYLDPKVLQLRMSAFKCETYLQLGENAAAINLARFNDAKAKRLKLEQARPYFLNCMAQAYVNYGNYQQALPLIHSSITLSRRLEQPQALINGLWLRSQLDAKVQHNDTAIEDLRLALDLYPQVEQQNEQWLLTPIAYLNVSMAKLLMGENEQKEANGFLDKALKDEGSAGKIALNLSIDAANLALSNNHPKLRDHYVQIARSKLPELGSPFELAEAYKQIAFIDFSSGKYSSAEQLLHLSINTFKKESNASATISALHLLAQVKLAQGQESLGLEQMTEAIVIADQKNRYTDLKLCYAVLAKYFAEKGSFALAYDYQLKQFQAAENEALFIQNIWLSHLKSDLSRQQQASEELQSSDAVVMPRQLIPNSFLPIIFVLFSLAIFITWYHRQTPKTSPETKEPIQIKPNATGKQKLEDMLSVSKHAHYPLSLLVLDPSGVLSSDIAVMIEQLKTKLREQDLLFLQSEQQLLIMLPHTSEDAAINVIEQLSGIVAVWQNDSKVSIGLASMQQFDNLQSMVKRANVSQLRRLKPVSKRFSVTTANE
ncbi:response regulator receiver protein [Shewanella halifaxensis HAW-EB4]|uniref:Response regulator receiver protein n=1 Tax=Shewanella halifaxensis (strain HAW-EB4) TaxID=458817 RepID=B0TQL9_SHEHH|nr:histidine kinase [Shewanella halifaxensis]ABZ75012.1 response regulator receiver protein [Shewanella halifaxensis HAW-EB4]